MEGKLIRWKDIPRKKDGSHWELHHTMSTSSEVLKFLFKVFKDICRHCAIADDQNDVIYMLGGYYTTTYARKFRISTLTWESLYDNSIYYAAKVSKFSKEIDREVLQASPIFPQKNYNKPLYLNHTPVQTASSAEHNIKEIEEKLPHYIHCFTAY